MTRLMNAGCADHTNFFILQSGPPKIIADRDGKIIWHNEEALRVLKAPMPLRIGTSHIVCASADVRHKLFSFLEKLSQQPVRLALREPSEAEWIVVRGTSCGSGLQKTIYLQCTVSRPLRDVEECGLAAHYELTPGETNVLNLFARCCKPKEIAEELGKEVSTVRSHLKKIYAKLGVKSNMELLELVRAFCEN